MDRDYFVGRVRDLVYEIVVSSLEINVKQVDFLDIREQKTTEVTIIFKELIFNLDPGNCQVDFHY